MYAGRIVEDSATTTVFEDPLHPYTVGLLRSLPALGRTKKRLFTIPGSVPKLYKLPAGCRFSPRCPRVMEVCRKEEPPMFEKAPSTRVRCWLYS
jgi:peptide/nickel transport system ATP-binding protein